MKQIIMLSVLFISILLVSCGGGSSEPDTNSSVISDSLRDTDKNAQRDVDIYLSRLSINIDNINPNDNLTVTINSYDASEKKIFQKTKTVISESNTISILEEVKISPNGGKIVVSVSANGYTTQVKTISYSNPSEVSNLNLYVSMISIQ